MLKTNKLLFFLNVAIITAIATIVAVNAWNSPNNNPPSSTNQAMYISPTGNVGIGTTSPNATLDVVGTVNIFKTPTTMTREVSYTADTDLMFMCNVWGGTFSYIICSSSGISGNINLYSQNTNTAVNQAGCSGFAKRGELYACSSDAPASSGFLSKVYKLGR